MKKYVSCFFVILFLLILPIKLQAETPRPYVDDQAGILTQDEILKLTSQARTASHNVNCGIYIITVEDYHEIGYDESIYITKVLSSYYRDQGYGLGVNNDGVILMLSMSERDYSLYTHGFGDTGLSDPAMDYLLTKFLDDFKQNAWYNGFDDYIKYTEKLLNMTIQGRPFDENTYTPGEQVTGIFISFILAIFFAHLVTRHFEKQMLSVELETDAEDFAGKLNLTIRDDRYLNTTTTRVYDPPSSSSSGGGGRSGGGGSSRSGKF